MTDPVMTDAYERFKAQNRGPGRPPFIEGSPHCDQRVLHAPRTCMVCDDFPALQRIRQQWGIAYTNTIPTTDQVPCPSLAVRSLGTIERWPGNRAWPWTRDREQLINGAFDPPVPKSRFWRLVLRFTGQRS